MLWESIQKVLMVIFAWRLICGVAVCYRNFLVYHILKRSTKKSATDFVILCNLFSDGLYGAQMVLSFAFVVIQYVMAKFGLFPDFPSWNVGVHLFNGLLLCFDEFLTLFSLLMLFLMTMNRYFAILSPHRYKSVFRRSNMRNFMIMILLLVTFQFTIMLTPYIFFIIFEVDYLEPSASGIVFNDFGYLCYECCDFKYDFRLISYNVWSQIKMILVVLLSILMVVVYVRVSNVFKQSLWAPLLRPFSRIPLCQKKEQIELEKSGDSQIDNTNSTRFSEGQMIETVSVDDTSKCALNSDDSHASLKEAAEKKRFEQQRKITLTFFYVGVFFIFVALPSSMFMATSTMRLNILMCEDSYTYDVEQVQMMIFISFQALYGAVFLLNPFLYSFRHPYIRTKLKNRKGLRYYYRQLFCSLCSRNSEISNSQSIRSRQESLNN